VLLGAEICPKGAGDFMIEMMARANLSLDMEDLAVVYARVRYIL
jgi:hypothetical protein